MAASSEKVKCQVDDKTKLFELVEELTTSGKSKLDENSMKNLKRLCKRSTDNLSIVYRIILNQMEKNHAEIRLSCFQMINELFMRSHAFRKMVLADFDFLLELCVETNDERRLPPPKTASKVLKSTALSSIETWHQKFGMHYKKLEIGYDFLKRVKRVDFAGVRSRTLLERQKQESLETRQRDLMKRALEKVQNELKENCLDIKSAVVQGNSCLNLIFPRPCDFYPESGSIEETMCEKFNDSSSGDRKFHNDQSTISKQTDNDAFGKFHGIPTNNYKLTLSIPLGRATVVETDDNKDILGNLHDLMNEIRNKFVPMVNKWINILTKCNAANGELEKCMELKYNLKEIIEKYNEIEIDKPKMNVTSTQSESKNGNYDGGDDDDDDDDDDNEIFEDVPEIEDVDFGIEARQWVANETRLKLSDKETNATALLEHNDKVRLEKLKSIAPVVPFDQDLKYWGSSQLHITPITKNDSLHKFWSHGEVNDDFVPDSLEASLRSRAIVFPGEFKKVLWNCRAPLGNGQLCERQDRLKCPFHGKIIPRDKFGLPSNPEDLAAENKRKHKLAVGEAEDICKDIEIATGKDLGYGKNRRKQNIKKQRYSRLTNLRTVANTSRKRLENKVLQKGALNRVDEALSAIEKRRNLEKFGSNFNYHYER